jgi:hypothetical protein
LNNNFYIVFPYKDLPLRKLYNRIILGVKVMKRTWNRWVRERLRICREIGTSEELFALRDILVAPAIVKLTVVVAKFYGS